MNARSKRLTISILFGFWVLVSSSLEGQYPNVARGFTPSGMFDVGGIDSVNQFSGNMFVRIPIGHSYPVGGLMGSYSFNLVYNSNVWTHLGRMGLNDSGQQTSSTYAVPDPLSNAGLGWTFSLGRLGHTGGGRMPGTGYLLEAPPAYGATTYHAPDGSQHRLCCSSESQWFSADGTYLRYDSSSGTLEFPDGTRHVFNATGYPVQIVDRFGNGLTIDYVFGFQGLPEVPSEWVIHDGFRTHRVVFRTTGLLWPRQQAVIDYIELERPGGPRYEFRYNGESAPGSGFWPLAMTGFGTRIRIHQEPDWHPNVFVLTDLILPDGARYSTPVASYAANNPGCDTPVGCPGPMARLQLPTGGALEWDYILGSMPVPAPDDEFHSWWIPTWEFVVQIAKRRLIEAGGVVGEWEYGGPDYEPGILPRWNELVRQVKYPSPDPVNHPDWHTRVLTYYSTCGRRECINEGNPPEPINTYTSEYGLPFSRRRPDDGSGRFLSQEVYPPGSSTPSRQTYVRYDPPGFAVPVIDGVLPEVNQRLQSERTIYLDDRLGSGQYAWTAVDRLDYDDLGHYREVRTSDNFGWGGTHIQRTQWNPGGRPGPGAPWILNTFTYQERQEGASVERQEYTFEGATGFPLCRRTLRKGRNQGPFDLLVTFGHTDPAHPGDVTEEKWYGGDSQHLQGSTCGGSIGLPAQYSFSHSYTAGVRSRTTVQATTTPPATETLRLLDVDVDASSGLVTTSRDISGRATAFHYEAMGRLDQSHPPGDATTTISYALTSNPPRVDLFVGSTKSPLEQKRWTLDGLGRIVKDETGQPDPQGSGGDSLLTGSRAVYNALGWKTRVSERTTNPTSNSPGARFESFDAFGRPGDVYAADGSHTRLEYSGTRQVIRTQWVWDGTGERIASTKEEYDGRGRLRRVVEPTGTSTRYGYDVAGRLVLVVSNERSQQAQKRTFAYDGRGFLTREVQPESGTVDYRYDARGNVTQRITPNWTILSEYDQAGRLRKVSTPQGVLKELTYWTGAQAGTPGASVGSVRTAIATNHRVVNGQCTPYRIDQDFAYWADDGRVAAEATTVRANGTPAESWVQGYTYDDAGRVIQTSYPQCLSGCTASIRSQDTDYTMGRTVDVPGLASLSYNENGTVHTVSHENGVTFTQTPDATGMARPQSLGVVGAAGPFWPTESYAYDSSGNIKKLSWSTAPQSFKSKRYTYDRSSRLTSAVYDDVEPPYRGYDYDPYGNITKVSYGASAATAESVTYQVDWRTNHLTTPGVPLPLGASYDPRGNLTTFAGSTYSWDPLDQLAAIDTGSEAWIHTYDVSGERVWSWRTSPSRIDTFALRSLDGKVLSDFTKTGGAYSWEDYVYREGMLLAARYSDGRISHFDVDHLGNARLETDGGGGLVAYRQFWPYGEEATPPVGTEQMRFTGHERDLGNVGDAGDDLDYMHARYYKPLTARFLSPDPSSGDPRAPQSWNRYAYVQGRPLVSTDPTGRVLEYTSAFVQRVRNDPAFRRAFKAWKATPAGRAQWKAMKGDRDTRYRMDVAKVTTLTSSWKEVEQNGSTTPNPLPQRENKSGKLNESETHSTVNADLIERSSKPGTEVERMAKAIFEEAAHGLDLGSGTMSAADVIKAEERFHSWSEPRMTEFESQLEQFLGSPENP